MTNKMKYNKKYNQPADTPNSKTKISKQTGIPKRILDKVWDRGRGARLSNPQSVRSAKTGKKVGGTSLKGKMSGQARVYSFVMKQPGTWGRADKDLADEVKKLKIKGYSK